MLIDELRNKIDSLWEVFWIGDLINPLDIIEQITYLMFIRDLDDINNTKIKNSIRVYLLMKIFLKK